MVKVIKSVVLLHILYYDPRIIVSWARDKDLDIGKIYPKTAQDKFAWSLDTKKSFYKNYPEV